jgi:hypothetical protein
MLQKFGPTGQNTHDRTWECFALTTVRPYIGVVNHRTQSQAATAGIVLLQNRPAGSKRQLRRSQPAGAAAALPPAVRLDTARGVKVRPTRGRPLLPLAATLLSHGSIAMVGPLANASRSLLSGYVQLI